MAKFTEEQLYSWTKPASESEEGKISNAISMIKDAIDKSEYLKSKDIEVFVQGSYANNTNVKTRSDVDVNIMLKDTFYDSYPDGLTREDYGFVDGTNKFSIYKEEVRKALLSKFETRNIEIGNKSIKIIDNSYRVEADAVPSFQYRNYKYIDSKESDNFVEGVKFFSTSGEEVINYPKKHIENGIVKNTQTKRRFKRVARILKRIRHKMKEDKIEVNQNISSFLIECLVWNVPNKTLDNYNTWEERLKQTIIFLYKETKDFDLCKEWREISELLYLFHDKRKWSYKDVNEFARQVWQYMEWK